MVGFSILLGYSSTMSLEIFAPANSLQSNAACFRAYSVPFGSIPLSKRKEASVLRPCLRADFLIHVGWKYAASKTTFFVVSYVPEPLPPKTPAIHIGSSALQMARSCSPRMCSSPSRVMNFFPAFWSFTIIL